MPCSVPMTPPIERYESGMVAMDEYIQEALVAGIIHPSSSLMGAGLGIEMSVKLPLIPPVATMSI